MNFEITPKQFSEISNNSVIMDTIEFEGWFIRTYLNGHPPSPGEGIKLIVPDLSMKIYNPSRIVKVRDFK